MYSRKGEYLAAAKILLQLRKHLKAAQLLSSVMAARSEYLLRGSVSEAFHSHIIKAAESGAVPPDAFDLLTICTLALRSMADIQSLHLDRIENAAEESNAKQTLQLLSSHVSLIAKYLGEEPQEQQQQVRNPDQSNDCQLVNL